MDPGWCILHCSAYRIQFKASFGFFRSDQIWKAQVENKCKFFALILLQDKILTAHNLQKRGWPHQEHCVLCNGPLETGLHLCLCCPFAKAVWDQIYSLGRISLSCSPNNRLTPSTSEHGGRRLRRKCLIPSVEGSTG